MSPLNSHTLAKFNFSCSNEFALKVKVIRVQLTLLKSTSGCTKRKIQILKDASLYLANTRIFRMLEKQISRLHTNPRYIQIQIHIYVYVHIKLDPELLLLLLERVLLEERKPNVN